MRYFSICEMCHKEFNGKGHLVWLPMSGDHIICDDCYNGVENDTKENAGS